MFIVDIEKLGQILSVGSAYKVVSGWPKGSDVYAMEFNYSTRRYHLYVSHPSFPDVPEGETCPLGEDTVVEFLTKKELIELEN